MSLSPEQETTDGRPCQCAIITVSDVRTAETDENGLEMAGRLGEAGHGVVERTVVPGDPGRVALVLRHWIAAEVDAILVSTGHDGGGHRGAVDVVRRFLERELPGYGEIFRMLAFEEVGPTAMFLDAVAGMARGKAVFLLSGSRQVVAIGLKRLVVPELRHAVEEARKWVPA